MTLGELSLPRVLLVALGGAVIPLTCHAGGPATPERPRLRERAPARTPARPKTPTPVSDRARPDEARTPTPVSDRARPDEARTLPAGTPTEARSRRPRTARTPTEARTRRPRTAGTPSEARVRQPRRTARAPSATPTTASEPRPSSAQDAELATLQRLAVAVARAELEQGVVESPFGSNRGPRIDRYARIAGMSPGQAWCGHFVAYCYTAAARRAERSFSGQRRLHSVGKTRSFFNYRNYTQRATPQAVRAWEALRQDQRTRGPARRYMTFRGSHGDRWASERGLPHETYSSLDIPVRAGDTVIFVRAAQGTKTNGARGHLGLVESYADGVLTTIEGNTSHKVQRKRYDLRRGATRRHIDGFGRPALADFQVERP